MVATDNVESFIYVSVEESDSRMRDIAFAFNSSWRNVKHCPKEM